MRARLDRGCTKRVARQTPCGAPPIAQYHQVGEVVPLLRCEEHDPEMLRTIRRYGLTYMRKVLNGERGRR